MHADLKPLDKFKIYIEKVCNEFDMVSAIEAEIAKYCFCDKSESYSKDLNYRIGKIKENFLNRNSNPEKRLKNIFNAVQDLNYGQAALAFSEQEFFGKKQETWIATLDSKLYWLSESIHHHPVDGEPDGKYYTIVRNAEQLHCEYWQSVDDMLIVTQDERARQGKVNSPLSEFGMKSLHQTLIQKGFSEFKTIFNHV